MQRLVEKQRRIDQRQKEQQFESKQNPNDAKLANRGADRATDLFGSNSKEPRNFFEIRNFFSISKKS